MRAPRHVLLSAITLIALLTGGCVSWPVAAPQAAISRPLLPPDLSSPPTDAERRQAAAVRHPVRPVAGGGEARRFYHQWWFWNAVGVVVIGAVATAIALDLGGTDRVVQGPDGRFNAKTFPSR